LREGGELGWRGCWRWVCVGRGRGSRGLSLGFVDDRVAGCMGALGSTKRNLASTACFDLVVFSFYIGRVIW
jgi:hypothetical protein